MIIFPVLPVLCLDSNSKKIKLKNILTLFLAFGLFSSAQLNAQEKTSKIKSAKDNNSWRSKLYPENWKPGFNDGQDRFLHDFSYAGYHQGEKEIPFIESNIVDITQAPYNADNTGTADVTVIIQRALNDVGQSGGGVVFLPAGTYKVKTGTETALRIKYNKTILRGAGVDSTFIYNTNNKIRQKSIIWLMGDWCTWSNSYGNTTKLRTDILLPTRVIPVKSVKGFKKGDDIILRTDGTKAFIEEHLMTGYWTDWSARVMFLRTIDSIDVQNNFIYIDSPTRYFMKTRDNARIYHAKKHIEECGIEHLSIGNQQSDKTGWGEEDYIIHGTGAYDVHGSHAIYLKYAQNCWVQNVNTFKPKTNTDDFHVLSNCLILNQCRGITVDSCFFQKPQYEGGGGNGYMFTLTSNDCLIKNSRANHSRHNYDFKFPYSNGNVIHNCIGENSKYSSDFHMYLSMSNLFDVTTIDKDYLESNFRPWGGDVIHGYSSTQSVFYNTLGKNYHPDRDYIVDSRQFKHGYIIGTSGAAEKVKTSPITGSINGFAYDTSPIDFVEGVGKGADLMPQSLYLDQLQRRLPDTIGLPKLNVTINVIHKYTNQPVADCEVKNFEQLENTDISGNTKFKKVNSLLILNFNKENFYPLSNQQLSVYSDTTITFYLTPLEFDITIAVRDDQTEDVLVGAPVTFNGNTKVTNNIGETYFEAYEGEFSYSIEKNSYTNESGNLIVQSDSTYTIYLTRSSAYIKFRLKYGTTPINNATVILNNDTLISTSLGIAKFANIAVQEEYKYMIYKDGYSDVADTLHLTNDTTINVSMTYPTQANFVEKSGDFKIWPNPVSNEIHFQIPENWSNIYAEILNLQGSILKSVQLENSNQSTILLNEIPDGIYLLKIFSSEEQINKLFIKSY